MRNSKRFAEAQHIKHVRELATKRSASLRALQELRTAQHAARRLAASESVIEYYATVCVLTEEFKNNIVNWTPERSELIARQHMSLTYKQSVPLSDDVSYETQLYNARYLLSFFMGKINVVHTDFGFLRVIPRL